MQDGALSADQPVLDSEVIVTGTRRDFSAFGIPFSAAPFGVHRPGLDSRNHSNIALRRSRQHHVEGATDRAAAACRLAAVIFRRVLVIERYQSLDVAGVERVKPLTDEIERIER